MKVLVACEESQRVCVAFRERGYEAYSCDIQTPKGVAKAMAEQWGNHPTEKGGEE